MSAAQVLNLTTQLLFGANSIGSIQTEAPALSDLQNLEKQLQGEKTKAIRG